MLVRKFCQCGVKLDRHVSGEATARQAIDLFRAEHSGIGHGPVTRAGYEKTIRCIIDRRARGKSCRMRGGQRGFRDL